MDLIPGGVLWRCCSAVMVGIRAAAVVGQHEPFLLGLGPGHQPKTDLLFSMAQALLLTVRIAATSTTRVTQGQLRTRLWHWINAYKPAVHNMASLEGADLGEDASPARRREEG